VNRFLASRGRDWNSILRRLDVELTERCNNNCIHCYINLPAGQSAGEGERALDRAHWRHPERGGLARLPLGAVHRRRTIAEGRF